MTQESAIKLFEERKVRTHWDDKQEKWYFSVVDVVAILTDSPNPNNYWKVLKNRLNKEGNELVTNCNQLKMQSTDGKYYKTDVADTEQLFRIIQSIPSPKAEPFKQWLARVGAERIQETSDPELSINRARENWRKHGRSEKWIQLRMSGQETRNKLTDYWKSADVTEGQEFAALTNIIHEEWAGLSVSQHKAVKGLNTQNLRDHMSEAELLFTALAELSTRQIAETEHARGFRANAKAGKEGGSIARRARRELEEKTGRSVVTGENFLTNKKE